MKRVFENRGGDDERRDLSAENLGGEELEVEERDNRRSEERGGDVPSFRGLLEVNKPLIGGDSVGRERIVIQDVDCFCYFPL